MTSQQPLQIAIVSANEASTTDPDLPILLDSAPRPEDLERLDLTDELPTGATRAVRAAEAITGEPSAQARVELVRGPDGGLLLMELELIEPALFLSQAPDAAANWRDALPAWRTRSTS